MTVRQIAIDGPAGAGKSTAAKAVADSLGYLYIDTGAMYRAIALLALRQGIAFDDEARLAALAESADLQLLPAKAGCRVLLDGEDVSLEIRRPEVGNAASPVSALPGVRKALVARQQQLASTQPVVMDGRDVGTVVMPQAELKIFLVSSPRVRAERRALELQEKGFDVDVDTIEKEMKERDLRDSTRAHSPLVQAEDAVVIDNSLLEAEDVLEKILELVKERS